MPLLDDLYTASRARRLEIDHFIYSAVFNTLAANAVNQNTNVPIDNDADFVIRYINLASFSAVGVPVASPDYLLQLMDTGSGRNLQNQAQHVANVCGTAQRPGILPEPKLIHGGGTLSVLLTNLTAVAARVDISFIGLKLFWYRSYSLENFREGLFGDSVYMPSAAA